MRWELRPTRPTAALPRRGSRPARRLRGPAAAGLRRGGAGGAARLPSLPPSIPPASGRPGAALLLLSAEPSRPREGLHLPLPPGGGARGAAEAEACPRREEMEAAAAAAGPGGSSSSRGWAGAGRRLRCRRPQPGAGRGGGGMQQQQPGPALERAGRAAEWGGPPAGAEAAESGAGGAGKAGRGGAGAGAGGRPGDRQRVGEKLPEAGPGQEGSGRCGGCVVSACRGWGEARPASSSGTGKVWRPFSPSPCGRSPACGPGRGGRLRLGSSPPLGARPLPGGDPSVFTSPHQPWALNGAPKEAPVLGKRGAAAVASCGAPGGAGPGVCRAGHGCAGGGGLGRVPFPAWGPRSWACPGLRWVTELLQALLLRRWVFSPLTGEPCVRWGRTRLAGGGWESRVGGPAGAAGVEERKPQERSSFQKCPLWCALWRSVAPHRLPKERGIDLSPRFF